MPFKSGDSLSAGEQSVSASASDAAPSERAEGSIASVGNLFGSPGSGLPLQFGHLSDERHEDVAQQLSKHDDTGTMDAAISKQQFDNFLGHAFLRVAQAHEIQLPWEKGIFKQIFGEDHQPPSLTLPWFPRMVMPEESPEATVQELASAATRPFGDDSSVYARAISCISDSDFKSQQSKLRLSACNKWLSILMVCLQESDVGRNIAALGNLDDHRAEALEILEAVIGVRSYHTAICRANAVLRFLRVTLEVTPKEQMPFSEELVWRYFHHLKTSGGATSAASMLSAVRYAKFVMGFECMDKILNSKRLKGYSDIMFASKRKLQQAQILTVQQVKSLHQVLEDPNADNFDRAAAGFMLTAVYGRCRVSDLSFLDSIQHDHNHQDGFVELFTTVYKTGRSAAKKATLLPILCPAFGVTGTNWAALAIQVFEQIGLTFNGAVNGPLLCPPSHEGPYLCKRFVTSGEVGKLLRGLIGLDIEVPDFNVAHVSSHSLKSTGLSMAARYGMTWPDRAVLGRHQSLTCETVAVYSRDLAIGPVSRFAEVVKAIHQGAFRPDAERSCFFPFPPEPPSSFADKATPFGADSLASAGAALDEDCKEEINEGLFQQNEVIDITSDSESSASESGDSCIASEDSEAVEVSPKRSRPRLERVVHQDASWVAHKKSGLLHFCWTEPSGGDPDRKMTACGRTVSKNFAAMDSSTDGNAICVICNRRQD